MKKKLTAVGNSWALIIEKAILDSMNVRPKETEFEMRVMDNLIVFEPVKKSKLDKEFQERVRRTMQKHDKTLKRLAEG